MEWGTHIGDLGDKHMQSRGLILALILFNLCGLHADTPPRIEMSREVTLTGDRAHAIRSAFIYNFILFTEWPQQAVDKSPLLIGIIGTEKSAEDYEDLDNKMINERPISLVFLDPTAVSEKDLASFHVLFIPKEYAHHTQKVLTVINKHPILTIGEDDSFLELGGMIRLFTKDNRLRFEIHLTAAKTVHISFRSRLLRLASRVIETPLHEGSSL